eukprot:XP_014062432.1 PREDICTED: SH2 domain-containing protein 4B-like [Salmo salar]
MGGATLAWVRAPRPSSRECVLLWFKEEQMPKQVGYECNSATIAPWFHGRDDHHIRRRASAGGIQTDRLSHGLWGLFQ